MHMDVGGAQTEVSKQGHSKYYLYTHAPQKYFNWSFISWTSIITQCTEHDNRPFCIT